MDEFDPVSFNSNNDMSLKNIIGQTQLSNIIADLKFDGKGILHYGGSNSDNGSPRNRFLPFFEEPKDFNNLKSYPKKAFGGKENGLVLWLDAEVFEDQFDRPRHSQGFLVGFGHPFDFEQFKFHGFGVEPGTISHFGVSTYIINTGHAKLHLGFAT